MESVVQRRGTGRLPTHARPPGPLWPTRVSAWGRKGGAASASAAVL